MIAHPPEGVPDLHWDLTTHDMTGSVRHTYISGDSRWMLQRFAWPQDGWRVTWLARAGSQPLQLDCPVGCLRDAMLSIALDALAREVTT